MDNRALLKELGVGLLLGALLTGSFSGLDINVLTLGFIGICMVILGVAYKRREDEELHKA